MNGPTNGRKYAVIILAAGKSSRCNTALVSRSELRGIERKKTFFPIIGSSACLISLEAFACRVDVCQVILVVAPEDKDEVAKRYAEALEKYKVQLVVGGAERFLSVENALRLVCSDADYIAVHDAARPCVSQREIDAVFLEARQSGAAILAVPTVGALKRARMDSDRVVVASSEPRDGIWEAQTPQVFRRELLFKAYRDRAREFAPLDDCGLVEALGVDVSMVRGDRRNIKITSEDDLALVETILKDAKGNA